MPITTTGSLFQQQQGTVVGQPTVVSPSPSSSIALSEPLVFIRATSLLSQTVANVNYIVPIPAGTVDGDLLYVVLNIDSKSATVTTPTGWLAHQDVQTSVALGNRTRTYYKTANAAFDGSSVTFVASVAKLGSAICYAIGGSNSLAPINAAVSQDNAASSTAQALPAITTTVSQCLVIGWVSSFINSSYTPAINMIEDADQANADTTMEVSHFSAPADVMTIPTQNATSGVAGASIAGMVAIAPQLTATRTRTATPVTTALSDASSSASVRDTQSATGTTSVTVNAPAGLTDGDLLFAQIGNYNASTTAVAAPTAPAGWTQIDSGLANAGTPYIRLTTYWKIAASEGASWTWTSVSSDSTNMSGIVSAFIGSWGTTPLDVHSFQQNASGTSAPAASVTATTNNSVAVMSVHYTTAASILPAASFYEPSANGTVLAGARNDFTYRVALPSGATGTPTATLNAAGLNSAFLAVFKPFVGATTTKTATPVTVALQSTITQTATPVTAALLSTITRTATPVTAALQSTITRTATPITAFLAFAKDRTATPVTAALQSTITRTATPVTAALQSTLTRTATPVTASLVTVNTRTASPVTAALKGTLTRTSTPVTAALQSTITRTATPVTAALQSTLTRTATPVTAALKGTLTRTASPVTAALQSTLTRTATPVTASLVTVNTRTATPVTASLVAVSTRTGTPVTAALLSTLTRTATPVTASLAGTVTRTAGPITASLFDARLYPFTATLAAAVPPAALVSGLSPWTALSTAVPVAALAVAPAPSAALSPGVPAATVSPTYTAAPAAFMKDH